MFRFSRARCLIVMAAVAMLFSLPLNVMDVNARSGGGGGSRSSGMSRSPSRSSSSPSRPSPSVFGQRSGGGINKPSAAPTSSGGYKKAPTSTKMSSSNAKSVQGISGSRFDRAVVQKNQQQRAANAKQKYETERAMFKKTPAGITADKTKFSGNPVYRNARTYGSYDHGTYYGHRDAYYSGRHWNAPSYVYLSQPTFGMWDAFIWWSILDNLGDRNQYGMAYHHANDPGYQEWRREADRLSAENAELRGKLKQLDTQVSGMSGVTRDPGYLPTGVDPAVALSADVMVTKAPEKTKLRLATGSASGNYARYGELLKASFSSADIALISTAGSMENLQKLISGEVDAALVQSDVLALMSGKALVSEQTVVYQEVVHMVANDQSNVFDIADLRNNNVVYVGPTGSGTAKTWDGICKEDSKYSSVLIANASYQEALDKVHADPNAVMLFVSGLNNPMMSSNVGDLHLISISGGRFDEAVDSNGNKVYEAVKIDNTVYPSMAEGKKVFGASWGKRNVQTIAVDAVLVIRTDWVRTYGQDSMDALSMAIVDVDPQIARIVHGHN